MNDERRQVLFREALGAGIDRDTSRALKLVDEVLAADPDDVEALLIQGNILEMMHRIPLARAAYERVLQLEPGNVVAMIDVADCDADDDRFGDALARLDEAQARIEAGLDRDDRDDELESVMERKYSLLVKVGRESDAHRLAEHALVLFPDSTLWAGLGTPPRGDEQR